MPLTQAWGAVRRDHAIVVIKDAILSIPSPYGECPISPSGLHREHDQCGSGRRDAAYGQRYCNLCPRLC